MFSTISGDFYSSASSLPPYYSLNTKKCSLETSWVTLYYLQTAQNSPPGKFGGKNTTHSYDLQLTVFLSSLNRFMLEILMAERVLGKFSLMTAYVWINLAKQVTRKSTRSTGAAGNSIKID